MTPNNNFELNVADIDVIETSLRLQLSRLAEQRLTHIQSTIIPVDQLSSVTEIDGKIKQITDLLGRIHNQKNWYRPTKTTYISG